METTETIIIYRSQQEYEMSQYWNNHPEQVVWIMQITFAIFIIACIGFFLKWLWTTNMMWKFRKRF